MKESMGGASLFYIVIFIIITVILLLISSISFSKAYRVKNRIVDVIEKYESYNDIAVEEINDTLASIGYTIDADNSCKNIADMDMVVNNNNKYHYCVYKSNTNRGYYYKIISYVHLEIPLIGASIEFPVKGTTKTIYTNNGEV